MRHPICLILVLGSFILALPGSSVVRADVTLEVDVGWDGLFRGGRWVPIFVTATDAKPHAIRIDVEAPQGGPYVMQLSQYLTIGPQRTTIPLYVPMGYTGGDAAPTILLRDANSGKTLAQWPENQDAGWSIWEHVVQANKKFIGVVGVETRLESLASDSDREARVAYLKTQLLPETLIGYDLFDLVIVYRAGPSHLPPIKQQALVDWIRGGGCVLVIPPDDRLADGPLTEILPCRVGQARNFEISAGQRQAAGLMPRSTGMTGFELTAKPGADAIELIPGDGGTPLVAYSQRVGYGRVIVVPFDVTQLRFSGANGEAFYERVLAKTGALPKKQKEADGSYAYGTDAVAGQQERAVSHLQDYLGNVPGAGRFGFSYVAWVVLGMMVLVGPVDWFVLKMLGRQPWTWVTTSGWIGLITLGALFIGHVFKSGELHYRTVDLFDQADDKIIARTTLAGVYSPRTTTYHFDAPGVKAEPGVVATPPEPLQGWWDPAAMTSGYGRGGLKFDAGFHQTSDGNSPEPVLINVWNLRFLHGQTPMLAEPMIQADLRLQTTKDGKHQSLVGTVRNTSLKTLTDVRIRMASGYAGVLGASTTQVASSPQVEADDAYWRQLARTPILIASLAPGQTVNVKAPLIDDDVASGTSTYSPSVNYRGYRYGQTVTTSETDIWAAVGDLAAQRTARITRETSSGDACVIYASVSDYEPSVVLREPGARQQHHAFIRALVKLKPIDATTTRP